MRTTRAVRRPAGATSRRSRDGRSPGRGPVASSTSARVASPTVLHIEMVDEFVAERLYEVRLATGAGEDLLHRLRRVGDLEVGHGVGDELAALLRGQVADADQLCADEDVRPVEHHLVRAMGAGEEEDDAGVVLDDVAELVQQLRGQPAFVDGGLSRSNSSRQRRRLPAGAEALLHLLDPAGEGGEGAGREFLQGKGRAGEAAAGAAPPRRPWRRCGRRTARSRTCIAWTSTKTGTNSFPSSRGSCSRTGLAHSAGPRQHQGRLGRSTEEADLDLPHHIAAAHEQVGLGLLDGLAEDERVMHEPGRLLRLAQLCERGGGDLAPGPGHTQ